MEFLDFYKLETFFYQTEEKNSLEEIFNEEQNLFGNLRFQEKTLIYSFKMNKSIRLDYLLQLLDLNVIVLNQKQLLILIFKVSELLVLKKNYFIQSNLENIWLHLQEPLLLNKQTQKFEYKLQFVGLRKQNQVGDEQNQNARKLLYQIYASKQNNTQRITIINFLDLNFERMRDIFHGAVLIMQNYSAQNTTGFTPISDFEINNLRNIISQHQSKREDPKSPIDCYKNLKAIEIALFYLKQRLNNIEVSVPNLTNLESDLNMDHDVIQTSDFIRDLKIDQKFFKYYIEQKYGDFQNHLNKNCKNIHVALKPQFKSLLLDLMEMNLIDYLFQQGRLNNPQVLIDFSKNELIRKQLIECIIDPIYDILLAQFKTQIEYQINEIIKKLL